VLGTRGSVALWTACLASGVVAAAAHLLLAPMHRAPARERQVA
jgi:hypothetical protein